METFSTAGPTGSYEYWALTASPKISDVKPTSPEPGIVDIRVLCEGGQLPDEEIIKLVYDTVSADKVRPITDQVFVSAPEVVDYDIDLVYYIPKPRKNSASLISGDAEKAINDYIDWQSARMGLDINPDELIYRLKAAGIKRIDIKQPQYTVLSNISVAVLKNKNIVYGGVEDE